MQHHEFVGQVQQRAGLANTGEAENAIRATLETLAERLAGGEEEELAAQLPQGIAAYLRSGAGQRNDSFSVDDFFRRVSERAGTDRPAAIYHARVVIEVLQEAVNEGEIRDVLAQLPDDFKKLFEAGSGGHMSIEP